MQCSTLGSSKFGGGAPSTVSFLVSPDSDGCVVRAFFTKQIYFYKKPKSVPMQFTFTNFLKYS